MLNWLWRGKLRDTLLIIILLLTLAPALAAIAVGYHYTVGSVSVLAAENLKNLADAKVEFIESWFFERANVIRFLAEDKEIKTMDPARILPVLEQARQTYPDYKSLAVADQRGINFVNTITQESLDLSGRSYMKAALGGSDYISEVLYSLVDQKPVVVLASPIKNGEQVVGAVLGVIDIDRISREMLRGYHGRTGEVFLVNRDGLMVTESRFTADLIERGVVSNKTSMELKVDTLDVSEALHGRSGFGRFVDYRGVEVMSRYRWLPYIKMGIVAKKDLSEIMEESGRASQSGAAVAVLIAIVFLPLVILMARMLSKPLELLAESADRIAGGYYGRTIDLRSNREVDALAASFNRMSLKLKDQHEAQVSHIALLEEQKQEIAMQNKELAEANARLETIAITDQLTGAYNRRYILTEMEQVLAVAVRHGLPLSVIMIDIDHFKNINDTYGHQVGDEVLKELVRVLADRIRTSDVLGRYGGEEFVVVAPVTGLQEALALAERLRDRVSKWPFATTHGVLKLTISLGVATLEGKIKDSGSSLSDRLLAQADAEMYRAKAQGRNRVSPRQDAAVEAE